MLVDKHELESSSGDKKILSPMFSSNTMYAERVKQLGLKVEEVVSCDPKEHPKK